MGSLTFELQRSPRGECSLGCPATSWSARIEGCQASSTDAEDLKGKLPEGQTKMMGPGPIPAISSKGEQKKTQVGAGTRFRPSIKIDDSVARSTAVAQDRANCDSDLRESVYSAKLGLDKRLNIEGTIENPIFYASRCSLLTKYHLIPVADSLTHFMPPRRERLSAP